MLTPTGSGGATRVALIEDNEHIRTDPETNGSFTRSSHPDPDLRILQPEGRILQNRSSRIEHQATLQLTGDEGRVGSLIIRESNRDALLQDGRKGSTFNRNDQVGGNTAELNFGSQDEEDEFDRLC